MLLGAQVRMAGGLGAALDRGTVMGAGAIQVFTQNARAWRATNHDPQVLETFSRRQAASPSVCATYCHATYLINLASPSAEVYERSRACLAANLAVASAIGSAGLVLHVGSHLGEGLAASLPRIVEALAAALDASGRSCPILLENTAGAGGSIGRNFEELAAVISAAGGGRGLGVCLDTQHLWAADNSYASLEEADALVSELDASVGLDRLACLHLNDSKVERGAARDRHENLGAGTIGRQTLGYLLGHPRLQHLPAILEVPGEDGNGPGPRDLAAARAIHAAGLARWSQG
jgi:deoxyribonuclease-4